MSHQSTTRGSLNIWDEGVRKYVVADPRLHESSSSLDDISLDPFTSSGRSTARESPQPELAYPYVDAMPRSMNRLRLPLLGDTCERLLKSALPFVDPYHYNALKDELHAFQQGAGKELQRLLEAREAQQDQPSWLEQFCDDMYLENRDPLPINVNYFFGFKPHPVPAAMTQVGRAASLLHAALEVYVQIRDGTLTNDMERASPLCMSQMRRVFCASRVPGEPRDSIVSYSTAPLTADERLSKTCQYVAVSPSHCVVIVRNRFYRVRVLDAATHAPLPLGLLVAAIGRAAAAATSAKDPGPPVGLLTTMQRGEWAEAYGQLKQLGNDDVLLAMQSAIMVVCLDSMQAEDTTEAARLFLHGAGTNRWFDRHNLIVAQNGVAGINFEHSVGDGATTLRVADYMFRQDAKRALRDADVAAMAAEHGAAAGELVAELQWRLDSGIDRTLKSAFSDFIDLIESNETTVLHFRHFGGNLIKNCKLSPDAFVQLAFQLTYYRLFGRNDATYEAASTRAFLHGRTETLRVVSKEANALCIAAASSSCGRRTTWSSVLLRPLVDAFVQEHVRRMAAAKRGCGVDRHFFGLQAIAQRRGFDGPDAPKGADRPRSMPSLFRDPAFLRSRHWHMSTSHCGSTALHLFGFGPVVHDGFGLGYMIFNDEVHVTITCKRPTYLARHSPELYHCGRTSEKFALMLRRVLVDLRDVVDPPRPPSSL